MAAPAPAPTQRLVGAIEGIPEARYDIRSTLVKNSVGPGIATSHFTIIACDLVPYTHLSNFEGACIPTSMSDLLKNMNSTRAIKGVTMVNTDYFTAFRQKANEILRHFINETDKLGALDPTRFQSVGIDGPDFPYLLALLHNWYYTIIRNHVSTIVGHVYKTWAEGQPPSPDEIVVTNDDADSMSTDGTMPPNMETHPKAAKIELAKRLREEGRLAFIEKSFNDAVTHFHGDQQLQIFKALKAEVFDDIKKDALANRSMPPILDPSITVLERERHGWHKIAGMPCTSFWFLPPRPFIPDADTYVCDEAYLFELIRNFCAIWYNTSGMYTDIRGLAREYMLTTRGLRVKSYNMYWKVNPFELPADVAAIANHIKNPNNSILRAFMTRYDDTKGKCVGITIVTHYPTDTKQNQGHGWVVVPTKTGQKKLSEWAVLDTATTPTSLDFTSWKDIESVAAQRHVLPPLSTFPAPSSPSKRFFWTPNAEAIIDTLCLGNYWRAKRNSTGVRRMATSIYEGCIKVECDVHIENPTPEPWGRFIEVPAQDGCECYPATVFTNDHTSNDFREAWYNLINSAPPPPPEPCSFEKDAAPPPAAAAAAAAAAAQAPIPERPDDPVPPASERNRRDKDAVSKRRRYG